MMKFYEVMWWSFCSWGSGLTWLLAWAPLAQVQIPFPVRACLPVCCLFLLCIAPKSFDEQILWGGLFICCRINDTNGLSVYLKVHFCHNPPPSPMDASSLGVAVYFGKQTHGGGRGQSSHWEVLTGGVPGLLPTCGCRPCRTPAEVPSVAVTRLPWRVS